MKSEWRYNGGDSVTLTQDDLRQLYEAGMPCLTDLGGYIQWKLPKGLTFEAALVGYATQLLRDLFPNETRNVRCDGRNGWLYDHIKYDNYPSLVALIVDLARMKRENKTIFGCPVVSEQRMSWVEDEPVEPESVTAKESEPIWIVGDKSKVVSREEFNQLRADVREIAEATAIIARHLDRLPPSNQIILAIDRLRKVVERE